MTAPSADRPPASALTDAYAPPQIARKVVDVGVAKARLPFLDSFALAVLAGAFIGLGAAFSTVAADATVDTNRHGACAAGGAERGGRRSRSRPFRASPSRMRRRADAARRGGLDFGPYRRDD